MSEIEEQPVLDDNGFTEQMSDALSSFKTDDAAPEVEASTEEPNEQLETDDIEPAAAVDGEIETGDYLEVDDDNLDTKFRYNGEDVTIGELFESHANRTAPDVIESQRQEIESMKNDFETQRAEHSYIDNFNKPHVFIRDTLERMVQNGSMPFEVAEAQMQALNASIEAGLYSPKSVEDRASQIEREREYETQRETIEREKREIELSREVIGLEAKYGKVDDVIGAKIMDIVKGAASKGQEMTLTEAFGIAKTKGYFNQPPKNRKTLADEFRSKGTKSDAPDSQTLTMEDALAGFR